ncbi:hypothetical protein [Alkaliphilus transvaalensis]|uniref:hypothetical protein n=1 Tax=Alkaliphilus transvaalensis TaxID=114628 RepID=UPI00047A5B49|nr:hypothetical protein [Alkaliphilus transvaalensis]
MSRKKLYKLTGRYGGQRNPMVADFETSNEEVYKKHCKHIASFGADNYSISFWTPESEQAFHEVLED